MYLDNSSKMLILLDSSSCYEPNPDNNTIAVCNPYCQSHHFTLPHITSHQITSRQITLPYLTLPYLTSYHITSNGTPLHPTPQVTATEINRQLVKIANTSLKLNNITNTTIEHMSSENYSAKLETERQSHPPSHTNNTSKLITSYSSKSDS